MAHTAQTRTADRIDHDRAQSHKLYKLGLASSRRSTARACLSLSLLTASHMRHLRPLPHSLLAALTHPAPCAGIWARRAHTRPDAPRLRPASLAHSPQIRTHTHTLPPMRDGMRWSSSLSRAAQP